MITTTYTSEEWQAYAECAAPTINNDIFFSEEILYLPVSQLQHLFY